jgi:hypothetical protein
VIYYFPYDNGQETIPQRASTSPHHNEDNPHDLNEIDHQNLQNRTDVTLNRIECEIISDTQPVNSHASLQNDPIFSIFWQSRLVPESFVFDMPFFPKADSNVLFKKLGNESLQ